MRITVKIGTSSLTDQSGALSREKLTKHVEIIARVAKDHEIILVTSGSIASGFGQLGYQSRPKDLIAKQASAAVGQGLLISAYSEEFARFGITVAQVLLTRADFSRRDSCDNAKAAMELLLKRKALPIVNENDLVAVEEINFGDNDMLSALLSGLMQSEQLIIFTDQNGLYDKNPREHPDAKLISEINEIDEKVMQLAGSKGSKFGKGGMASKLLAAKLASTLGVKVFIGSGQLEDHAEITEIIKKTAVGTYLSSLSSRIGVKKQWLAFHAPISGKVFIDAGAMDALLNKGYSLLPVGVKSFEGHFEQSDVLEAYCENKLLGRGITNYSSAELEEALNSRNDKAKEELIHRDYWMPNISEDY